MRISSSIFVHCIDDWAIGEGSCWLVSYFFIIIFEISVFHISWYIIDILYILRLTYNNLTIKHLSSIYVFIWITMRISWLYCKICASTQKIVITRVIDIETLLFILIDNFRISFRGTMEKLHLFWRFTFIKLGKR
jgi:hypothetical protein